MAFANQMKIIMIPAAATIYDVVTRKILSSRQPDVI